MPKSFKLGCGKEHIVASTSTVKTTNDSNPPAYRIMPPCSRIRSKSAPPRLVTVHNATFKPEDCAELLQELEIGSINDMNPIRYLNPPELIPELEQCVMPDVSPVHGHLMDPESNQDTEPECLSVPELIPMTAIFSKLEHGAIPKQSSVTGVFQETKLRAESELRLNLKIIGSINHMNPIRSLNPPELIPVPELSLVHGHFMDPELGQETEPIRMHEHSSMTGIFPETERRQIPNLIPMPVLVPEIIMSAESEHRLDKDLSSQPAHEIIPSCSRIISGSTPLRLVSERNITFEPYEEPEGIQELEMGSTDDMNPIHNRNPPNLIHEFRRFQTQENTYRPQQESNQSGKPEQSSKPAISDGPMPELCQNPGPSQKDAFTMKRGANGKLQEDEVPKKKRRN